MTIRLGRRSFIKALAAGSLAAACGRLGHRRDTDIVVLGAGLAGLAAARRLLDAGREFLVIEGRDRPGGRVHTAFDLPDRPEYGAVEVGDSYTRVHALAAEYGLRVEAADHHWFRSAALHVNGHTIQASAWPGSGANRLAPHEQSLLPARIESHYLSRANPLRAIDGWDAPEQRVHDQSIGDILRGLGASPEALRLVNVAGNHNHADEVSALPAWKKALALGLETGTGSFVDGTGALPMAMAGSLEAHIRYACTVVGIASGPQGVNVLLKDGTTIRAKRCVCALPVPVLRTIGLDLPMANEQRDAIRSINYTRVTVAFFDAEPFWEDDGLPPYMWTDTPLERLFPRVSADGEQCIGLKAFINGRGTAAIDGLAEADFERLALTTMQRIRPASDGRVRYLGRHRWGDDPFAGGAYAAWSPGKVAAQRTAVRLPAGHVRFAGEHTALDAPGLEGAIRSGERVAQEIIEGDST